MKQRKLSKAYQINIWCALFCGAEHGISLTGEVQSRVFIAKCSEPQVGISNGMDRGLKRFISRGVLYMNLKVSQRSNNNGIPTALDRTI